jgi:DNA-binding LytR/AlgR family response regulator
MVRRILCSGYVGPLHLEAVHSGISLRPAGSRNQEAKTKDQGVSIMTARENQDQKAIAPQAPRIAFKANGSILLLDLADISAVQAEGNYVSLQHRPNPYLVHESLSSMVEKLKPYGFIRIHRSVVVNISAVEEIQPLPTGEYRLRVKGGKEYLVTRTYKHNLRDLAQLWVGSERLCG